MPLMNAARMLAVVVSASFVTVHALGALTAHYTFNDSGDRYADLSGNGYDGTIDGSGTTFAPSGMAGLGDAMETTTGSRVLVNTEVPVSLSFATISYWATPGTIWDNWISYGSDDFFLQMSGYGNSVFLDNPGNVPGYEDWGLAADIPGSLSHVAVTMDSAEGVARLYTNGCLADTSAWTVSADEIIGYLTLGGARGTTVRNIDATIDDVQVYDTELSDADIAYLYNHPGETIAAVPEPSTLSLAALAVAVGLLGRRRRSD